VSGVLQHRWRNDEFALIVRLDALEAATALAELNQPGFNLHMLKRKPVRHSIHVSGPWCITFEWDKGKARRVDLDNAAEQKA
jgi:toxin HigB-1